MSTDGQTYMHDKPPEMVLAELINDHMGKPMIAPSEVRAILTTRWRRISVLAHAIHTSTDDGWPKFTPKPDPYAPPSAKRERDRAVMARAMADAADNTSRLMSERRRLNPAMPKGPHPC